MIAFSCHQCGRTFSIGDEFAGRKAKCKTCNANIVIPSPKAVKADRIVIGNEELPSSSSLAQLWPPSSPVAVPQSNPAPNYPRIEAARRPTAAQSGTPRSTPAISPESIVTAEIVGETREEPRKLPMRTRRLLADAEQVRKSFSGFPLIQVKSISGDPPDSYVIEYFVRGLSRSQGGQPHCRDQHLVEIQLTREYPRQSPKCRMLTPIFHPNIEPAVICVGDHWAASERLVDLIIRIGELISFQTYNIKSPLDGEAAMWADQNRRLLPLDNRDLRPPELP
jgi:ubiquitin-protein ligase/DNA-directed RNA polymerase subunit RPC12/RpoP